MSRKQVNFSEMPHEERQVFIDFLYKEMGRHIEDVIAIKHDIKTAFEIYGIKPRRIFVGTRIEVGK